MGELYDVCRRVVDRLEHEHAADPMALIRAKGELATRAGFLVAMVGPGDPDNPEKLDRLKIAAAELGIPA